jgi:DNA-binding transcriptional LysR family regulator
LKVHAPDTLHSRVLRSFAVALEAALAGQGIALLPDFTCAESVGSGALQVTLDGFAPPPTPLFAIYPKNPEIPPRVRAFLALLQMGAPAPWTVRLRPRALAG